MAEAPDEVLPVEEVAPASEAPREVPQTGNFVSSEDFQAGLKALEEQIVDRMKESQKAVIQHSVSSEIGDKLSTFDEVAALLKPHLPDDLDVQNIKRQAFVDSLMSEPSSPKAELEEPSPPQPEPPTPASVPPAFEAEIQSILETTGVSGQEPELKEYLEKTRGKRWFEVGQGFNDLAVSIAARTAGTPAGVVAPQGQIAETDLVKNYRTELDALIHPKDAEGKLIQGQRRNIESLRRLQDKYRELGVKDEDLDISPKGKAPLSISDWAPPA